MRARHQMRSQSASLLCDKGARQMVGLAWLEQELHGLAVSVLRSVATTLGVSAREGGRGGRFLAKEDLVSKITTKFLPEVGDVLMSL